MGNLFQLGDYTLHSGQRSNWKIDCDALTDADLETLAWLGSRIVGPFGQVVGIPTGGIRFALACEKWTTRGAPRALIVDDVLTTGTSMCLKREEFDRAGIGVWGLVIFARGYVPWIDAIFRAPGRMSRTD